MPKTAEQPQKYVPTHMCPIARKATIRTRGMGHAAPKGHRQGSVHSFTAGCFVMDYCLARTTNQATAIAPEDPFQLCAVMIGLCYTTIEEPDGPCENLTMTSFCHGCGECACACRTCHVDTISAIIYHNGPSEIQFQIKQKLLFFINGPFCSYTSKDASLQLAIIDALMACSNCSMFVQACTLLSTGI